MNYTSLIIVLLSAGVAYADGTPAIPQKGQPPAVEIIDGKKFFSLRNARRFTGGTPPSGIMAMHHARNASVAAFPHSVQRGQTKSAPSGSSPPAIAFASPATPQARSDLLSIFAPEEKSGSPSAGAPFSPIAPLPWADSIKH